MPTHTHTHTFYTLYKKNNVFDSYNVYQCFKCQGFNHSAKHCEKNQVCAKCGGNHRQGRINLALGSTPPTVLGPLGPPLEQIQQDYDNFIVY